MNKKKILYIHHGKGLGGAPLSLLYLIQALDKTKYHPVVLFLYDSEVVDLFKSKGIEVVDPINVFVVTFDIDPVKVVIPARILPLLFMIVPTGVRTPSADC